MKFPHGKCVTSVLPPKLEDVIVFLSQIIKFLAYFKHWSEKAESGEPIRDCPFDDVDDDYFTFS